MKILINIILLGAIVLVGSPIKYNCIILNLIALLLSLIFMAYKDIYKHRKITFDKLDIAVIILFSSSFIPIIFHTYSSLEQSLLSVVKNISILNIYLLVKFLNEKDKNSLINTIIGGGLILVILAFDEMTYNVALPIKNFIGIPYVVNYESRMFSTLGYANSFAIIMAIIIILLIDKVKLKKGTSALVFVFLTTLLLTYSRSTLILLILILFIYFVFYSKKSIYTIYIYLLNFLISLIYTKVFEHFTSGEEYLLVYISLLIFIGFSIFIEKILTRYIEYIEKIKTRTYIILVIVIMIFVILAFIIGMKLDAPAIFFNKNTDIEEVSYNIGKINGGEHYEFIFNIKAESKLKNEENYVIEIVEQNIYYDTVKTHSLSFNNFEGEKTINFEAEKETTSVAITIKNTVQYAPIKLQINNLYINGKEHPLNYLYLPYSLVEKVQSIGTTNKSVWERLTFFKDGVRIVKDNFLFGTGGNGWLYNYENIQSYFYESTEVHNYFLKIFIENGIVAAIAYLFIIIYFVIGLIKKKKIDCIDCAFILLTLHSLVDFDLSFYFILLIWSILLRISMNSANIKSGRCNNFIFAFIIVINIIGIIFVGLYFNVKTRNEELMSNIEYELDTDKLLNLTMEYNENEPYYNFNNIYLYVNYSTVTEGNMEYLYNKIKSQKLVVNTEKNIIRNRVIENVLQTCNDQEIVNKFAQIVINENTEMIDNINAKELNRLSEYKIQKYISEQKELVEMAKNKKQKLIDFTGK